MSVETRIRNKVKELRETIGVQLCETADEARDRAILCFKASKHEAALDQLILLAACEEISPTSDRDKGAISANIAKCLHHLGHPLDSEANSFYDSAIKLLGPPQIPPDAGCFTQMMKSVDECAFSGVYAKRLAYVEMSATKHAAGQSLSANTYLDGAGEERQWSAWEIQEAIKVYEDLRAVLFPPKQSSPPSKFKFSLADVSDERRMKGESQPVPSTPRGTLW